MCALWELIPISLFLLFSVFIFDWLFFSVNGATLLSVFSLVAFYFVVSGLDRVT